MEAILEVISEFMGVIESLTDWFFVLLERLGVDPRFLTAALVGLPTGWCLAQHYKKKYRVKSSIRIKEVAFIGSFLPTYFLSPGFWPEAFFWAALIGLSAPATYELLVAYAGHRWKWVNSLGRSDD